MRCIELDGTGRDAMRSGERPDPVPGPGEISIRVAYAGVNRPDLLQRDGRYPPPPGASDLLGLEASGEVVACGSEVRRWRPGDLVTGLLPGGGYAEIAVTPAEHALPVPGGLTLAEAASLPETFFTVWTNLFEKSGLAAGEVCLVHGGASGIGTAAIQLARAFGARVFATAGSDKKCARCRALGAETAINYRQEDFVAAVKDGTEGHGADVILDMVGGDYMARNFRAAARDGRIASIAFLQGSKIELDFAPALVKRLTWRGSTLRARPDADKARIARALEREVWPRIRTGEIRPVVDSVYPLAEVGAAHDRMERSLHVGKILLAVRGDGPAAAGRCREGGDNRAKE